MSSRSVINLAQRVAGVLVFDLVWLSAVAGRTEWLWATLLLVLGQIALTFYSGRLRWLLLLEFAVVGMLLVVLAGLVGGIAFDGGLLPWWMLLFWLGCSAMALNVLDWFAERLWFAVAIGLVSGPITYIVGVGSGAAEAPNGLWWLGAVYACLWA